MAKGLIRKCFNFFWPPDMCWVKHAQNQTRGSPLAPAECWIIFSQSPAYQLLPTTGEAKAKVMPGRLYIHTTNNNKTTFVSYLNSPRKECHRGMKMCVWTHLGLIKWKTNSKNK
jgi:hypothetical protein